MKIRRLAVLRPIGLVALGVFLGRGAQADTIVDFDGVGTNINVPADYASNAVESTQGVTVEGFGTPNIGLTWGVTGGAWQYYLDGVWAAGQLDSSDVGDTHSIVFAPNSASARAVIKSFNFHPYYVSFERFTYNVTLRAGATVVHGPTVVTFVSDGTKEHPVSLDYTGALGQALELRIERVASALGENEVEGDGYDIAVDDIVFAQDPAMALPVGPQVVSVTPANGETNSPAIRSYHATISDAVTTVAAGSIQLKLDGTPVSPTPAISSAGGMTEVTFQAPGLFASGSAHTYTLTYNDTGIPAASYTHEVHFTVANYPTLPASYASPAGSASGPGFTCRTALAAGAPTLPSTLARAREQLAGTLVNPDTQEVFENAAEVGPNPDGSFDVATVLDFDDDGALSGNFDQDTPFPGLSTGGNNWFSARASMYLDLPPGYYRFGVNSDDGFEASVGAPAQGEITARTVLGFFDDGRAADDTVFDFLVQNPGVYRFELIYFESGGAANCEFYSVNLANGEKALINDLAIPNAIRSYRLLTPTGAPRITSVARSGSDLIVEWVDGVPPFQVQTTATLAAGGWNNSGAPTTARAVTIPIQPGAGFVRVVGQ